MSRLPTVIALTAGGLFALLALLEKYAPGIARMYDPAAAHALVALQAYAWAELVVGITALGNTPSIVAVTMAAVFLLRKDRHAALRTLLAVAGSALSVELVKLWVARPRPEVQYWIDALTSFSFPSGHAASAMALYGSLALVILVRFRSRSLRALGVAIAFALITGIGLSRLILGAHFLSDVLGGYLLGIAWIALSYVLMKASPSVRYRMRVSNSH